MVEIHFHIYFQIKESPEGDWNLKFLLLCLVLVPAFKLKNPRKGTETYPLLYNRSYRFFFQIKESPEGDWNITILAYLSNNHKLSN